MMFVSQRKYIKLLRSNLELLKLNNELMLSNLKLIEELIKYEQANNRVD